MKQIKEYDLTKAIDQNDEIMKILEHMNDRLDLILLQNHQGEIQ